MGLTGEVARRTVQIRPLAVSGLDFSGDALPGGLGEHFDRAVEGILAFIGVGANKSFFRRTVLAVWDASGDLLRRIRDMRTVSSSVGFTGVSHWLGPKFTESLLTFAGTLLPKVLFRRFLSGSIDETGSVSKTGIRANRTLFSSVGFSGLITSPGRYIGRFMTLIQRLFLG